MRIHTIGRALAVAGLFALLIAPAAAAYDGQVAGQVIIAAPSATVDCADGADITATILETGTGDPIEGQTVEWSLTQTQSPDDALSDTETRTNAQGQTTVHLTMGDAAGNRTVHVVADEAESDVVIKCAVGGLPPTSVAAATPAQQVNVSLLIAVGAVIIGTGILLFRFARR